jgi:uncharacterized protein (DUF4415 family)
MKKAVSKPLTPEQKAELKTLAALSDEEIDTREVPEIVDWSSARRGALYRPVKQQITLRIDAEIIEWFRSRARWGEGYQTIGPCGNISSSISDQMRRRP